MNKPTQFYYKSKSAIMGNPLWAKFSLDSGKTLDLTILASLWGIAILLVNPAGDFPLNDDWSYGIAVKRLVEEGVYEPTNWTSMSLISQVWWGALFSYIFGFSFETLRISTLVLSLLVILCIYLLIRKLNQPRWLGLLVSLTIAFNPIYFALSFTYMTDIPFIAFTAWSLFFFLGYIKTESHFHLIVGTILACLAILCRQNGLFIPLAFGITIYYKNRFKIKALLIAIFPLLMGLGVLFSYQFWMAQMGTTPGLYGKQVQDLWEILIHPGTWPFTLSKSLFIAIMYLGLFLLPVSVLLLLTIGTSERVAWTLKWVRRAIIPLSFLLGIAVIYSGKIMPITGNVLHAAGVGPLTLQDTYFLNLENAAVLPREFWIAITIISVGGGACLLIFLASVIRFTVLDGIRNPRNSRHYMVIFFLSGTIIYFLPMLFLGDYDRYLLVPIILIALAFFSFSGPVKLTRSMVLIADTILLGSMAVFSLLATSDYLLWNKVRWLALHELTEKKNVPYSKINGGFEFNGFSIFNDATLRGGNSSVWWTEADDIYLISFGPVPGYKLIKKYEFEQWLPPEKGEIWVLKRPLQ